MAGSLHDWLKRRERALPVGGMVKVGKDKVGKDRVGKDKVGKDKVARTRWARTMSRSRSRPD